MAFAIIVSTSNIDYKKYTGFIERKGWFSKTYSLNDIESDSTLVILTFGQSSAGNCAKDVYQPSHNVFNYYNGKIFKAVEPLKGANGNGGISTWSRMADKLIQRKKCKKVILVPIARGGTSIEFWATGEGSKLLDKTLNDLKTQNIKLTHILWHQGEANNGNDPVDYYENLQSILARIRQYDNDVPFYCAIATYSAQSRFIENNGVDVELQKAQLSFTQNNDNVYLGANTDNYISAIYRYDGQHFSSFGNLIHSELWYEAITSKQPF